MSFRYGALFFRYLEIYVFDEVVIFYKSEGQELPYLDLIVQPLQGCENIICCDPRVSPMVIIVEPFQGS
jgi:hypothetical protein